MNVARIPLILLGAGGHARVLHALALAVGYEFVGVCDPGLTTQGIKMWRGMPVLGNDDVLRDFDAERIGVINGIGQSVEGTLRRVLYEKVKAAGFRFPALVHPAAWVAGTARLGDGVQVMAAAVIQPDCVIGENCIINTNASIDHDCHIGAHVHIAPGATLCGGVHVGDEVFIGSGSTVIQGLTIEKNCIVGAGAILTKCMSEGSKAKTPPASIVV